MSAAGTSEVAYLVLGSNIQPERHMRLAAEHLRTRFAGVAFSSVWRSPAVGGQGPDFLNAAARLETPLSAAALKKDALRPLETELGRVRTANPNEARVIDLDLAIHGDTILDPEIWKLEHLAVPLAELLPGLQNPASGETLAEAARRLTRHVKNARLSL